MGHLRWRLHLEQNKNKKASWILHRGANLQIADAGAASVAEPFDGRFCSSVSG
jgi:hypothetical protein